MVECDTDQTYYTGDNGYVLGWVAGYSFSLGSEKFSVTNWNEYEFDRDASYAAGNGGKDGINGAVALWWNATPHLTAGVQYRYADNKLRRILPAGWHYLFHQIPVLTHCPVKNGRARPHLTHGQIDIYS